MKKQFNFTALAIVCVAIFAVSMVYWTVNTAISNPVQVENMYMSNYQYVDRNIIEIRESEKKFDKKFEFQIVNKNFTVGENKIIFNLINKKSKTFQNAKVSFIVTTPYTNEFNKNYIPTLINNQFISNVTFKKQGRWIFMIKIEIDKLTIFKHIEVYIE